MGIHSDMGGVWLMHDAPSNQNWSPPIFSSHDLETGPCAIRLLHCRSVPG
jgi:hypothetical protein